MKTAEEPRNSKNMIGDRVKTLSAKLNNVSLDEDEEIAWNQQQRKKNDGEKRFLPSRPTGFWLFANSLFGESLTKKGSNRVVLNATFGKLRTKMIDCAQPLWNKMSDEEKKEWYTQARNVKLVTNHHKNPKGKKGAPKPLATEDYDDEDDEECDPDEIDMSVEKREIVAPVVEKSTDGKKYDADFEKISAWLRSLGQNDLADVKRARFLFASIQTYGDLDRNVIPAEIAIAEFSLRHGILDLYSEIVGPWEITNDVLRFRANFNCKETHKIPIDLKEMLKMGVKFTPHKKNVVGELLGRVEPYIARRQGVQVGLYREGVREFDDEFEIRSSTLRNGKINASTVVQHLSDLKPVLPGPDDEHRWIICLDRETDAVMRALEYLKNDLSFDYKGFPTTSDRFISVSAFVDAFNLHIQSDADRVDYDKVFAGLGSPKFENTSSWEANDGLFCSFHRKTRNPCCASVTACRACVGVFTALKDFYELDLLD